MESLVLPMGGMASLKVGRAGGPLTTTQHSLVPSYNPLAALSHWTEHPPDAHRYKTQGGVEKGQVSSPGSSLDPVLV